MNETEFDRSLERLTKSEVQRSRLGYAMTLPGQALTRLHYERLAARIGQDRGQVSGDGPLAEALRPLAARYKTKRDRAVWGALKATDTETLAVRLLTAGISVAESDWLGTNRDGEKTLLHTALWIGGNLGCARKLGLDVGAWGIRTLTEALPDVFVLDTGDVLRLTTPIVEFTDEVLVEAVKKNPLLSPLLEPPHDWTQVNVGGLPADHWAKVSLIRDHDPSNANAVRNAIGRGRMRPVLDAVNSLQRVPFAINKPVLDFLLKDHRPSDPRPKPPVWQKEKFQQWQEATSRSVVFHLDAVIAEAMACAERFWIPLNIDFRGRLYGISHFNFQREDRVRGLFLFADGAPIGEEGLKYLKAHVAKTANGNTFSAEWKPGRLGLDGRVAWTDANIETLRQTGEAVLRGEPIEYALPKDRYQFLAACVELVQALNEGPSFITRFPLTFDGSCSGLQHLCAMTRSEEGRYVNLVEADEQDDFYTRVANRVWDSVHDTLPDIMAARDDRDIVKQPAMSFFYGSSPGGFSKKKHKRASWRPYGTTKQIVDVLKERKQPTKGAKKLAHAINKAIGKMVPRAKATLHYIEYQAEIYAKAGKSWRWTTLLGLPVINAYHERDEKLIAVRLNGRRRFLTFVLGDKPEIDWDKAIGAATANFVHSVDATHLQMVALEAAKAGIETVPIHDCFGTIAPHAARLNTIIRDQFIELHENNLLAMISESAKRDLPRGTQLAHPLEIGTLDLKGVRHNYHAWK
jgi:DNA-directed RNA polymerase